MYNPKGYAQVGGNREDDKEKVEIQADYIEVEDERYKSLIFYFYYK